MKKKELVRSYVGQGLTELADAAYSPIVEGIVYHGDLVIMNGRKKANKSTFALQLACSVSSGAPFLGEFRVPKAENVWYFSTEGKDDDTKDRLIRMMKAVPTNLDNIRLFCSTQFKFNTPEGIELVEKLKTEYADRPPALIIVDSLYSSFKGKLIEEDRVNDYLTIIRGLSEDCGDAAVFMFHHLKKPSRDHQGHEIEQTDDDSFGSVFFGCQADHIFTINLSKKDRRKERVVKCETQRSGNITERIDLYLNEPDPFYLSLINAHEKEKKAIINAVSTASNGLTRQEVCTATNMTKTLCYGLINELIEDATLFCEKKYGGKIQLSGKPILTGKQVAEQTADNGIGGGR